LLSSLKRNKKKLGECREGLKERKNYTKLLCFKMLDLEQSGGLEGEEKNRKK
jgi:hypothetical protein